MYRMFHSVMFKWNTEAVHTFLALTGDSHMDHVWIALNCNDLQ